MALPSTILQRGDRASQPAATSVAVGVTYYVTDELVTEQSNGTIWEPYSATGAGTGDVNGPASSVDKEIALFDSTSGKLLERATGTGIVRVTSGVYGTPGNVVESEITLADNTTNNASTSKHGLLKKLSNVGTEYMDGTGGWSVPAGSGGGGLVLLEQHTASASASLDFTTCISSTYDVYQIEFVNVIPASGSVNLLMRFSTNGGSSYDSGSNYFTDGMSWRTASVVALGGGSGTSINLTSANSLSTGNDSKYGVTGSITLYSPLSTAVYKQVMGKFFIIYNDNATRVMLELGGQYTSLTAADAFQFLMSSGNITSGTIRVYGYEK